MLDHAKKYAPKKRVTFYRDGSDIAKPQGNKMENIHLIHNGSTSKDVLSYYTGNILMKTKNGKSMFLHAGVINQEDESVKENASKFVDNICNHFYNYFITFINDSSYSDQNTINQYLDKPNVEFITRVGKNRIIDINCSKEEDPYTAEDIARLQRDIPMSSTTIKARFNNQSGDVFLSKTSGFVTGVDKELTVIVETSKLHKPMVLITNKPCESLSDTQRIYYAYLGRWKIERTFHFMKSEYQLEKLHVTFFQSVKNIYALCVLLYNFFYILTRRNKCVVVDFIVKASATTGKKDVQCIFYRLSLGLQTVLSFLTKNFSDYMYGQ